MGRRFVTKADIDAIVDGGGDTLEVDDTVTVTDLAREHARDRGVRVVRRDGVAKVGASPTPASVREAVRRAVIARLGSEPADLDRVIARVLEQQQGS